MHVDFAEDCGIDDAHQGEIEQVLGRASAGDGEGQLEGPVDSIKVLRSISGSRTGAEVLEVSLLHEGGSDDGIQQVAKINISRRVAEDWQGYKKHFKKFSRASCCTEVTAVTDGVLTGEPSSVQHGAVFYQHVREHAAAPDAPVFTLEQLACTALDDGAEAVDAAVLQLERLLRQLGGSVYREAHVNKKPDRNRLDFLASTLGPALVLEVDNAQAGSLRYGLQESWNPDSGRIPGRSVRQAAVNPAHIHASSGQFSVGSKVTLELTDLKRQQTAAGEVLIGEAAANVAVRVQLATSVDEKLTLSDFVGDQVVHGRIVGTRAHLQWQLLENLLGDDLQWDSGEVRLGGLPVGHPFSRLGSIMQDVFPAWIGSVVHGDLNPRNALFVDAQPFVIDYSEADASLPVVSDYTWLEFGLLRDVIAPRLSHEELLRLYRLLSLLSRCPDFDAGQVEGWILSDVTETFRAAYRLLMTVRSESRKVHNRAGGRAWWKEYFSILILSVCRTLKWSEKTHDRHTAAAAVVAAGVTSEFLELRDLEKIFTHWGERDVASLVEHLPAEITLDQEHGFPLYAAAVRHLDISASALLREDEIDSTRVQVVRQLCATEAVTARSRLSSRLPQASIRLQAVHEAQGEDAASTGEPAEALVLASDTSAVMLLGEAGAGKTTLAACLAHSQTLAITDENDATKASFTRLPVLISASALSAHIARTDNGDRHICALALLTASVYAQTVSPATCEDLLTVGGIHLTVDGFNELMPDDRELVVSWLACLRRHYPRTPLMLCCRSSESVGVDLGLERIRLQPVTTMQARSYIWDRLRDRPDIAARHPVRLINWLFERSEESGIKELAHTPLFLSLTVEWYGSTGHLPASVGELLTRFTYWCLSRRAKSENPDQRAEDGEQHANNEDSREEESGSYRYTAAEKTTLLGHIASFMVIRLTSETSRSQLDPWLERQGQGSIDEILGEIFTSELLWHEEGRIGFRHQLFQDYFAARELAACTPSVRQHRVLAFRWHEPTRILLGLPDVAVEVKNDVLITAQQARPSYAAWLLRHHHPRPSDFESNFLSLQGKTLRTSFAGPTAWQESAEALRELAVPEAWQVLAETVCSSQAPLGARQAALRSLGEARREEALAREDLDQAFGTALDVVLHESSAGLKEAGFRAIGRARATAFAGYAWEHVASPNPWSVIREAYHAAKMLRLRCSPTLEAQYLHACTNRLEDLGRELRRTSDTQTVRALTDERFALLTSLAPQDSLEVLLEHRFALGLAGLDGWHKLLVQAAQKRLSVRHDDPTAVSLTVGVDHETALLIFANGDDQSAVAAAHQLLVNESVSTEQVLLRVNAQSSPMRLLAAAAFVERASQTDLARAEDLIRALIAQVHPDMPAAQLDGLSALIDALARSAPALQAKLADEASLVLQNRQVTRAMHWPWLTVWSQAAMDNRDLIRLLEHPDREAHAAAVRLMSATDFLLNAAEELPRLNLSPQALRNFQACRPALHDGPAVSEFAAAVAFGGIIEEFDFVLEAAEVPAIREATVLHANSRYGTQQRTCADNAVAALGYLGRLLRNRQDQDSLRLADQAKNLLLQLPNDLPTSLERARRIALGLLGDWRSLLLDLSSDALLREAAFNIITVWEPVPWASGTSRLQDIAVDVVHRLSDPAFQGTAAREVLQKVRADLQDRIGSYVLADVDDPRTGREAV